MSTNCQTRNPRQYIFLPSPLYTPTTVHFASGSNSSNSLLKRKHEATGSSHYIEGGVKQMKRPRSNAALQQSIQLKHLHHDESISHSATRQPLRGRSVTRVDGGSSRRNSGAGESTSISIYSRATVSVTETDSFDDDSSAPSSSQYSTSTCVSPTSSPISDGASHGFFSTERFDSPQTSKEPDDRDTEMMDIDSQSSGPIATQVSEEGRMCTFPALHGAHGGRLMDEVGQDCLYCVTNGCFGC